MTLEHTQYTVHRYLAKFYWEHETQGKRKKPVGEENRRNQWGRKTEEPGMLKKHGDQQNQENKEFVEINTGKQ